ncbi:hypothetical protein BDV95DRAFT_26704 [Massariosphaeria phaeospora]|uniref:Uncharacterized protein n=1 Tax=Massariosphaeria phaeospora TaxID=100035 RepID=A0A7C8IFL7_9PLEO|nr:hypothetical protein BDV95DRAFT_26704 [Massariosphaeria phaeospora]
MLPKKGTKNAARPTRTAGAAVGTRKSTCATKGITLFEERTPIGTPRGGAARCGGRSGSKSIPVPPPIQRRPASAIAALGNLGRPTAEPSQNPFVRPSRGGLAVDLEQKRAELAHLEKLAARRRLMLTELSGGEALAASKYIMSKGRSGKTIDVSSEVEDEDIYDEINTPRQR